jgi:O-antigen ligase
MSITNLVILFFAVCDWETTMTLLGQGQAMWTPCDHIRYSLLLVTSILLGIHLTSTYWYSTHPYRKYSLLFFTFVSFLFIHFLAVKSGVVVIYGTLLVMIIYYVLKHKKWVLGIAASLILVGFSVLFYHLIPTLQKKVEYTIYDLKMFYDDKGEQYSDSGRLAALDVGWQIAKKSPILGVGAGNLRDKVTQIFQKKYPLYKEIFMPPNQFLFILAGTGIWGLGLFFVFLFFPIFYHKNYHNTLLVAFFVSQLISLTIEHALENSVGIFHYLLFSLLMLQTQEEKKEDL